MLFIQVYFHSNIFTIIVFNFKTVTFLVKSECAFFHSKNGNRVVLHLQQLLCISKVNYPQMTLCVSFQHVHVQACLLYL